MKPVRLRPDAWSAIALLGLLAVSCSGSHDSAGTPPVTTSFSVRTSPAPSSPTTPVNQPDTTPRVHRDPYPALCRRIALPDAQKLFRKPLGPMTTGGGSDCQFAPRGSSSDVQTLKVFLRLKDGDKTLFDHIGDISYGSFTPVTGLGYQAKWGSFGSGPPSVVDVRSGSFTCTVVPPSTEDVLTLEHPGVETDSPVDPTAAAAFARSMGRLCADIFDGS